MASYVIHTIVLVSFILLVRSVVYKDLEDMEVDCKEMMSCPSINSKFSLRSCECDHNCNHYGDCCVDAETRRPSSRSRLNPRYTCMVYGTKQNNATYAIQSCRSHSSAPPEVLEKCLDVSNISDPYMATPVTDSSSGTTYWNTYCAACNNVIMENVTTWSIKMVCTFTTTFNASDDYIRENIVYRPDLNKWGIYSGKDFHICELHFEKPDNLESVRQCRPNVISSCPSDWKQLSIKKDCKSYTAVVYTFKNGNPVAYKNPHCAICNGISANETMCDKLSERKKPFSNTKTLDINFYHGDVVGELRHKCGDNGKYDTYYKKCRNTCEIAFNC